MVQSCKRYAATIKPDYLIIKKQKSSLTIHTKTYYIICVEERRIVWNEAKNAENKQKHKIGFEVAQYVFFDPLRIWRLDRSENNTSGEDRW